MPNKRSPSPIFQLFYVLFALFIVAISGCASNEHLRENLKQSKQSENRIVIKEDASLILKSPIGIPTTVGLRRGIYVPVLENEFGTFYKGPEGCVTYITQQTNMGPYDGGIWMPRDKINNKPSIYYYFNYNEDHAASVGGLALYTMLESNRGNITFVPPAPDKTFLDDVYVTNF